MQPAMVSTDSISPAFGDHLVAGVQDADLHRLVIVDVVGECRAGPVPVRAPGAELVLDHPLAEVLVRDRRRVVDAELRGQRQFLRAGGGHDAVDHGVGKAAVPVDPVGQIGVGQPGQRHDRLAQDGAVALQVVAALAGERTRAPRPVASAGPRPSRRTRYAACPDWRHRARCRDAPRRSRWWPDRRNSRPRSPSARRCGSPGRPSARSAGRCPPRSGRSRSSSPPPRPTCPKGRVRSASSGSPAPAASPAARHRRAGPRRRRSPSLRQPLLHQPVQIPRLVRTVEVARAPIWTMPGVSAPRS